MNRKIQQSLITFILLTLAFLQATTIVGTGRGETTPNGDLRITFPLSKKVTFNSFRLQNPARLVVDIPNAQLQHRVTSLPISGREVQRVRLGTQQGTDLRIVVDMTQPMPASTALIETKQGYELVMIVSGSAQTAPPSSFVNSSNQGKKRVITQERNVQTARSVPKKNVLIVIDPGHGGKDPGALGSGGTREKDVVLEISKILRDKINREKGMRAILTRDRDIFIPLRERVLIARRNKADMFISIHADAGSRTADGASVYILSTSGASSEAARLLAQAENRSDLIGGVTISDKDDAIASMLLDISQDATIEASNALGKHLLNNLRRHANLHKRNVERAGFAVLKAPDIPSVLVETGFISNPNEERKLRTKSHQNRLAEDILKGIKDYYKERPAMELVYHNERIRTEESVDAPVVQSTPAPVVAPQPTTPPKVEEGGVIFEMLSQPQGGDPVANTPPPASGGGAPVRPPKGAEVPKSPSTNEIVFPKLELRSTSQSGQGAVVRYITERGDTMKSIAQKFKVSEAELKSRNGLPSNQLRVPVGTELIIP